MPAVRPNRSTLAPRSRQAASTPDATVAAGVISIFMALLSFVDSAPRAYRLKAGNADPPISTMGGTSPDNVQIGIATVAPQLVKDMLPPGVLQHTFDITIQAPGVAAFTT